MKKTALILMALAALFLVVGCGGKAADDGKDGEGGEAKKDLSPTDTAKAFYEAWRKGGKGLDEAVKYMTEKAGKGFKGVMMMEEEPPPDLSKIEYGDEKIDGDKATVLVKALQKTQSGKEKERAYIWHMVKDGGKWAIVGMQKQGKEKIERFDDEKLLKSIDEIMKAKEEKGK